MMNVNHQVGTTGGGGGGLTRTLVHPSVIGLAPPLARGIGYESGQSSPSGDRTVELPENYPMMMRFN